jgi:hypothetical protein
MESKSVQARKADKLISAEALLEKLYELELNLSNPFEEGADISEIEHMSFTYQQILELVNDLPEAYDRDAVIGEINYLSLRMCPEGYTECPPKVDCNQCRMEYLKGVVEKGGVS